MSKKMYFLVSGFVFWAAVVSAQQKTSFSSQNYVGITEGEAGTSFQLQTINGLRYETWFGGIGTGLDYYYLRSMPLFFSLSKSLNNKKRSFFISGDAGINFPWAAKSEYYSYYGIQKYFPGAYWASGIGYKIGLRGNDALLFTIGYSYKRLKGESEYELPCLNPPCPVNKDRFDYNLKRISLRAGWMF